MLTQHIDEVGLDTNTDLKDVRHYFEHDQMSTVKKVFSSKIYPNSGGSIVNREVQSRQRQDKYLQEIDKKHEDLLISLGYNPSPLVQLPIRFDNSTGDGDVKLMAPQTAAIAFTPKIAHIQNKILKIKQLFADMDVGRLMAEAEMQDGGNEDLGIAPTRRKSSLSSLSLHSFTSRLNSTSSFTGGRTQKRTGSRTSFGEMNLKMLSGKGNGQNGSGTKIKVAESVNGVNSRRDSASKNLYEQKSQLKEASDKLLEAELKNFKV